MILIFLIFYFFCCHFFHVFLLLYKRVFLETFPAAESSSQTRNIWVWGYLPEIFTGKMNIQWAGGARYTGEVWFCFSLNGISRVYCSTDVIFWRSRKLIHFPCLPTGRFCCCEELWKKVAVMRVFTHYFNLQLQLREDTQPDIRNNFYAAHPK